MMILKGVLRTVLLLLFVQNVTSQKRKTTEVPTQSPTRPPTQSPTQSPTNLRSFTPLNTLVPTFRVDEETFAVDTVILRVPLSNFILYLNQQVPDTQALLHSIQRYLQVGFLWNIQNVTWSMNAQDSASYVFGPGSLEWNDATIMNQEVIRQEQASLLKDTVLLQYVLQQDLHNPELRVVGVQMEQSVNINNNNNNNDMFTHPLSHAQRILLTTLGVLVCFSMALLLCLRRYQFLQCASLQKE